MHFFLPRAVLKFRIVALLFSAIVTKVLDGVASASLQVAPIIDFPLTLGDLDAHILKIIGQAIQKMETNAVCIHGIAGCGKTPLLMTLCMAITRRRCATTCKTGTPAVRLCSSFDGFRLSEGSATCGDILDDPDIAIIPSKDLKSFTDVSCPGHIVQRWGAYKMARGAPRGWTCNDIDLGVEPSYIAGGNSISHKEFMDMIRIAFGRAVSDVHIMAILKRASFILVTKGAIYCRPACEREVDATRVLFPDPPDFLESGAARDAYISWKTGYADCDTPPGIPQQKLDAEVELLNRIMSVRYPPPVKSTDSSSNSTDVRNFFRPGKEAGQSSLSKRHRGDMQNNNSDTASSSGNHSWMDMQADSPTITAVRTGMKSLSIDSNKKKESCLVDTANTCCDDDEFEGDMEFAMQTYGSCDMGDVCARSEASHTACNGQPSVTAPNMLAVDTTSSPPTAMAQPDEHERAVLVLTKTESADIKIEGEQRRQPDPPNATGLSHGRAIETVVGNIADSQQLPQPDPPNTTELTHGRATETVVGKAVETSVKMETETQASCEVRM